MDDLFEECGAGFPLIVSLDSPWDEVILTDLASLQKLTTYGI